jgi:hypothetical protein
VISSLTATAAGGQTQPKPAEGKLTGEVANATANTPIAKAFVLVHQPEGKKDFIVKVSNGKFELSLPPGLYDVFVSASGFAPACKRIKISAGQSAAYNPRLLAESDPPGAN